MKKIGEFIKNHKFTFGGLCCLTIALILFFIYFLASDGKEDALNDKEKENIQEIIKEPESVSNNDESKEKLPAAPATDTKKLLKSMKEVEVKSVTADAITLSNDVNVKKGEKIAVWVYSEPKFLGYFEVMVKNGEKIIEGLADALKNISVEAGDHNIALVSEKGKNIGYIDIYIKKSGEIKEYITETKEKQEEPKKEEQKKEETTKEESKKTETKEIKEEKEISFQTETIYEVNMLKGTKEVVQKGENGTKEITYKVTYENGKEVSREKVSEKNIKEAIDQIEKVGTSDFNMNKDMLTEVSYGPVCKESQLLVDDYGSKECDTLNITDLSEYTAIKINTTYYITSIKANGATVYSGLIKVSGTDGINLLANYKGEKHYFTMSMGGGLYEPLTKEICEEYDLKCGTW